LPGGPKVELTPRMRWLCDVDFGHEFWTPASCFPAGEWRLSPNSEAKPALWQAPAAVLLSPPETANDSATTSPTTYDLWCGAVAALRRGAERRLTGWHRADAHHHARASGWLVRPGDIPGLERQASSPTTCSIGRGVALDSSSC